MCYTKRRSSHKKEEETLPLDGGSDAVVVETSSNPTMEVANYDGMTQTKQE